MSDHNNEEGFMPTKVFLIGDNGFKKYCSQCIYQIQTTKEGRWNRVICCAETCIFGIEDSR